MGILWMVPAGGLNHLSGVSWQASRATSRGGLMDRMSEFTLLDNAVRGFGGAAAVGEADRQRQFLEIGDPGGERRLFGVGEGPAEAGAGAKQESMGVKRRQFVKKSVSEQWILSCKSLGRPLLYQM